MWTSPASEPASPIPLFAPVAGALEGTDGPVQFLHKLLSLGNLPCEGGARSNDRYLVGLQSLSVLLNGTDAFQRDDLSVVRANVLLEDPQQVVSLNLNGTVLAALPDLVLGWFSHVESLSLAQNALGRLRPNHQSPVRR